METAPILIAVRLSSPRRDGRPGRRRKCSAASASSPHQMIAATVHGTGVLVESRPIVNRPTSCHVTSVVSRKLEGTDQDPSIQTHEEATNA